jgi:uncharacterized protein RhaS with RHS repeats
LNLEKTDPPSENRVWDFFCVTYSCTGAISPQVPELHQETYTTTTTTVSGVVEWLSKDPIGINGGLNQYVSFGNNPVMFIDPDGEAILEFAAAKGLYMGGKYLAYKATPYVIAGGTWVVKKGPALVHKAEQAAYKISAWQPFQGLVHTTSIHGSHLNAKAVTIAHPTMASFGEIVHISQPYASQIVYGIAPGPGGPFASKGEALSWMAGWGAGQVYATMQSAGIGQQYGSMNQFGSLPSSSLKTGDFDEAK